MHLLPFPGEDGGVDGLGQQRMAEPEAARLRLGDQDAALHRRAERVAQGAVGQLRGRVEQRVADLASGRRGQAQHALRLMVEAGDALQQQVAQSLREPRALLARHSEKLLSVEGVALGTGGDLLRQRRGQGTAGMSRDQRRQLVALERAELENERRSGALGPVGKPPHPLGRRGLVGAVGGEQQDRLAVEVVREEDDEIERRVIGPVQILEHEQHGRGSGALSEQR